MRTYKGPTMSNERYDDEILSAIIDGEADAELVASVSADTGATARLENMRTAVSGVAEAPGEATAERRSASIAAALAAATPAPEVTSLAAARHERAETAKKRRSLPTGWVAAVAAVVAFIIAIPIALGLGLGSETADLATDAADTSEDSTGFSNDAADAAGSAPMDSADGDADEGSDDSAMEDDAMEEEGTEEEAMEDAAMVEESAADAATETVVSSDESGDTDAESEEEPATAVDETPPPTTTTITARDRLTIEQLQDSRNLTAVNNADVLEGLIDIGSVLPLYTAAEMEEADVSIDCLQASTLVTDPAPYALVNLTPFSGEDRTILVEFANDGSYRLLDAKDCAPLR